MSGYTNESGKFVAAVSTYAQTQEPEPHLDGTVRTVYEDIIPQVPDNPDARPQLIQYAEEYFGKYWFVTLVLILFLLFRRK